MNGTISGAFSKKSAAVRPYMASVAQANAIIYIVFKSWEIAQRAYMVAF